MHRLQGGGGGGGEGELGKAQSGIICSTNLAGRGYFRMESGLVNRLQQRKKGRGGGGGERE